MAGSQTNGFDAVLELSETRVRDIVRTLFSTTGEISIPIPLGTETINITGTPTMGGFPSSVTILAGNRVDIHARFNTLRVRRTVDEITLRNVNIRIRATVAVTGGTINLSFPSSAEISSTDPTFTDLLDLIVALINAGGGSLTRASLLAEAGVGVRDWVAAQAPTLPPIPIGVNFSTMECPMSVRNFAIHTIDHFAFVLVALNGVGIPIRPLIPAGFTSSNLGMNQAGIMLSNAALLGTATCFLTQDPGSPFLGQVFSVAGDCRSWTGDINLGVFQDITVRARALSFCIVGNEIIISGRADFNTIGVFGSGTFTVPVGFRTDGAGRVFPVLDPNRIRSDIFIGFEAWVYLAAILAAGIFAILAGPIVVGIMLAILPFLNLIATLIANAIVRSLLPGLIDRVDPLVASGYSLLPPMVQQIIGTVGVQQVILDDLLISGNGRPIWQPQVTINRSAHLLLERGSMSDVASDLFGYPLRYRDTYQINTRDITDLTGYEWFINGRRVTRTGSMLVQGSTLSFAVSGRSISVTNTMGESPLFTLTGRVRTASGYARSRSIEVSINGRSSGRPPRIPGLELIEQQFRIPPNWLPDPPPFLPQEWVMQQQFETALIKGMKIKAADIEQYRFPPKKLNIGETTVKEVQGNLLLKGAEALLNSKSGKARPRKPGTRKKRK